MQSLRSFAAVACVALVGSFASASAAVLYDNGPINGNIDSFTLNFGYALADSFTLSQTSTVTGVNFGVWAIPDDTMSSIDWGITSTPDTFPINGTASVSNSPAGSNGFGYNLLEESFSTGSIVLGPGTYFLALQNAVATNGDPIYWDQNDGPSVAWHTTLGYLSDGGCGGLGQSGQGTCSESFQILGTTSAVPLPAALPLLAGGLGSVDIHRIQTRKPAMATKEA
jgi:hypothetical protein